MIHGWIMQLFEDLDQRLRQSSDWAYTSDSRGKTVAFPLFNSGRCFRVSDDVRNLILCFPTTHAIRIKEGIARYRAQRKDQQGQSTRRVLFSLKKLTSAGILLLDGGSRGPYDSEVALHYARARPIPTAVCESIIRQAGVRYDTRILDVATGTGSLALNLAAISSHVSGIDISTSFLALAKHLAKARGVNISFRELCANKLIFENVKYDVITVCQAFHWLDPVWAVRGVCRSLKRSGHLFLIESKVSLPEQHPLNQLLCFGRESEAEVLEACVRHAQRYAQLLDVLGEPNFALRPDHIEVIREKRIFDFAFARAYFFTDNLKALMGDRQDPWSTLRRLLSRRSKTYGYMYWLVAKFDRVQRSWWSQYDVQNLPVTILDATSRLPSVR